MFQKPLHTTPKNKIDFIFSFISIADITNPQIHSKHYTTSVSKKSPLKSAKNQSAFFQTNDYKKKFLW